jgi:formylglycine-generating enzyme required for sulfatase activity
MSVVETMGIIARRLGALFLAAALAAGLACAQAASAQQQTQQEAEPGIETPEMATDPSQAADADAAADEAADGQYTAAPAELPRADLPPGLREGSALLNEGKAQDAAAMFEKMLKTDPGNASAHHYLGEAWLALDRKDKAQSEYETALKLDPGHPFALDSRIRLAGLQADRKREPAPRPKQRLPQPGTEIRDCPKCPVTVAIPLGTFLMPYPPGDSGRLFQEGPVRSVTFSEPIAVGKFEVTFDEWDACVADRQCQKIDDKGRGRGRRPAVYVTWNQATEFTKWLSKKTGKTYRLPSESEWEYAARAGNDSRYRYFGLALDKVCAVANVYDKRGRQQVETENESLPCDDKFAEAAAVGSFKPNAFGIHDTIGNVAEWVEDCLPTGLQWRGAPIGSAPNLKGDCSQRGFRGGSWLENDRRFMRSPDRFKYVGARDADLGFRVVRVLP